jgi:hypothetical protein
VRLFSCQACGQMLFFENTKCERCGRALGYLPERGTLSALESGADGWHALAAPGGAYHWCANAEHGVCNWLVPAGSGERYCVACRHNRTVPDLSQPQHVGEWWRLEQAKHRLFYSILRLGLPHPTKAEAGEAGLAFDFLADPPGDGPKVMTGHDNGLVTISLVEADDAEREKRRRAMGEPYRTLVGHFRHEVGHYFWDRLVRDGGRLDECRALFGDDREDYGEALKRHYERGAPADWRDRSISAYATSHPWEDFAETWAHYLHIIDTLETADAFRVRVAPKAAPDAGLAATVDFDPYVELDFERIIEAWLPVAFAVNSLNRSMGQPDLYPFVLAPAVVEKLGFVHRVVRGI